MLAEIINELIKKYPDETLEIWRKLSAELEKEDKWKELTKGIRHLISGNAPLVEATALKIIRKGDIEKDERCLAILLLGEVRLYRLLTVLLNAIGPEDAPAVMHVVREFSDLLDLLSIMPGKYAKATKKIGESVIMILDIAADTAYRTYNLVKESLYILKVALKAAKLAGDDKRVVAFRRSIEEIQNKLENLTSERA